MKKQQFFQQKSIESFSKLANATFKFVIGSKQDIDECFQTYIQPFNIDLSKVMLMPAASTKVELYKLEPQLIEWCKHYNVRYSTRLHIAIWDKKTGV